MGDIKGEGILCHMMFLHEIKPTWESVQQKRMHFKIGDHIISYGPDEFCMITGFKWGRRIDPKRMFKAKDILTSSFRPHVIDIPDEHVSVNDLLDIITDYSVFGSLSDGDAVRVVLLFILCRGFLGKELKDSVFREWLILADDFEAWNRLTAAFRIWIWEMMPEFLNINFVRVDSSLPRMVQWRQSKKLLWEKVISAFKLNKGPEDDWTIISPSYYTLSRNIKQWIAIAAGSAKDSSVRPWKDVDRVYDSLPKQSGVFGDCGVFVCIYLEQLVSELDIHEDSDTKSLAEDFRLHAFLSVTLPVVFIRSAPLRGNRVSTMFTAVAVDGNRQPLPVAYGFGLRENLRSWTWFLIMLECMREAREVAFISNVSNCMNSALNSLFPNSYHGYCWDNVSMILKSWCRPNATL
ncbi:hypothetical protein LXL04_016042 [Taraxacum kok-saghyz]